MTNVRHRIKEVLAELKAEGHRQTQIAESLGITQASVSSYSRGEHDVSIPVAMLFEANYGYRKDWILNGELPKKVDSKNQLAEVARIAKQGRDLDSIPEIRDLLPDIKKLKEEDYNVLVTTIRRFLGKK
ncbi:helix-turn-helix domain-containing protein [Leptospira bandrabouensis]|uniref:helix-turn-helix domain-containing protein n=1 Tax=Leptospira bandrabouensis TaxID=2484903 RepID=UPI00109134F8|nr:helix-turn-helix transcriptional regulator [Leptospira bandrabouensis]TGN08599.1 XRE family transcriptional regulator [Leptospira bandrabouensis]